MDAISDPETPEVVGMLSAQVGKTLIAKAAIGFYIDQDPSTILVVQPGLTMAETFSKDRLAPMLRDTPCLKDKVADARSRDSGNTVLHKQFAGGHLTIVGANAAAGLASRPIRVLLLDEVDRYPPSAGTEGDPVRLAVARTKTFWNRKIVQFSTPGDEETSRIAPAFDLSDQRHFYVPCPHCGHSQTLMWAQVKWIDEDPESAGYECESCHVLWNEKDRSAAVRWGKWVATFPKRKRVGFHLNELYSMFRRMSEIVRDFLEAKGRPETLKTFINTSLAEVWRDNDDDKEKVDADVLRARREPYKSAPENVVLVLMQVDVQDDRLEYEFVGWGAGEESWGLEYGSLRGDPGQQDLWDRLTDHLNRKFTRTDGAVLTVAAAYIDSAGHYTKQAYKWAAAHRGRVFPGVGRSGKGRPLIISSKKPMRDYGIKLCIVGVDTAKELFVMSRLKISKAGSGYCHFPTSYPDEFFDQLTSERRVVTYVQGRPTHRWTLKKGTRNEGLDLRAYGLALLDLVRPNFEALTERLKPGNPTVTSAPMARRPSTYLQGRR
jgi:phage terminase large subunit GpA-like protein